MSCSYQRDGLKVITTAYIYKLQSSIDENLNYFCSSSKKNPSVGHHKLIGSGYKRILMATYNNITKGDLKEALGHFIEDYPNINTVKFKTAMYKRCPVCYDYFLGRLSRGFSHTKETPSAASRKLGRAAFSDFFDSW